MAGQEVSRNDLCPCSSGKKFWQKCERMLKHARDRDVVVSVIFYLDGKDPGVDPFGKARAGGKHEDVGRVRQARRAFARRCLDWSERRPHLAGALGSAVLDQLLAVRWLERLPRTRAVRVTPAGRAGLLARFGLSTPLRG